MDRSFSVKCFVPWCTNSTTTTKRDKVFVKVPKNLQQGWCDQVGLLHKATTHLYCCEDHLNLQEDLQNYYEWKLMQRTPRMKPTAKLKISIPDEEDVTQRPSDAGFKLYKIPQHYPSNNFKVTLRSATPVPRPLAKWRRVCVIPHTGQDASKTQPQEPEPGWKPSEVISELQRLLLQTEVPAVMSKTEPTENAEWQPRIKTVMSLSKRNIQEDDATHQTEAVTNPGEESAPRKRPRRTCRKVDSVAEPNSDDEDDDSADEDDVDFSASCSRESSRQGLPELLQGGNSDSSCSIADEVAVVKEEADDESSRQGVPELLQGNGNSDSSCSIDEVVVVKEEKDDQSSRQGLPELLQGGNSDSSCSTDEVVVKEEADDKLTQVFVKEETQDLPLDIEPENYKALYIKTKEKMMRLEVENQRLIEENQSLNAKNQNLVGKIQKLVRKQEEQIINGDKQKEINNKLIKILRTENQSLTEQNSGLVKSIDALKKQNQAFMQQIQQQTAKITSLSDKKNLVTASNHRSDQGEVIESTVPKILMHINSKIKRLTTDDLNILHTSQLVESTEQNKPIYRKEKL